jgi:hypothetical protein
MDAEGPHLGGCGGACVKAVDAEKGTITFDDKARAEVAGKTFIVAKDANFAIDGKPGKLADIPVGAYVSMTLSADRQTARQVHAQGPPVSGVVKGVDAQRNTLTVDDRTYTVASDTSVTIDGQRGQLAGLPVGANVSLRLCLDQKTVRMINANAKVP